MIAILKRELKAYFLTPIGYIFMSLFLLVGGVLFARRRTNKLIKRVERELGVG